LTKAEWEKMGREWLDNLNGIPEDGEKTEFESILQFKLNSMLNEPEKTEPPEPDKIDLDSMTIRAYRGTDRRLVVDIEGPEDESDNLSNGSPDIRIWLNEALIYANGEVGDDLPMPVYENEHAN